MTHLETVLISLKIAGTVILMVDALLAVAVFYTIRFGSGFFILCEPRAWWATFEFGLAICGVLYALYLLITLTNWRP